MKFTSYFFWDTKFVYKHEWDGRILFLILFNWCQKISFKRGRSYIDSPHSAKLRPEDVPKDLLWTSPYGPLYNGKRRPLPTSWRRPLTMALGRWNMTSWRHPNVMSWRGPHIVTPWDVPYRRYEDVSCRGYEDISIQSNV